jgi:hypothetical protein
MRPLTKREKGLIGLVVIVFVVVLWIQLGPMLSRFGSGGELAHKREDLQTAQNTVALAQITEQLEAKLREAAGLQGRVISDSLLKEISQRSDALEILNGARRASDLAGLHPALEAKAEPVLAYKKTHGKFENLETLKQIRGSIFEGEQPQAVIAQKIAELAKGAGLKPNYQLNIKRMAGRKSETLPVTAKQNLVHYLYISELEDELANLQQQQERNARKRAEAEEEVMDAIFDAWWSDDETDNSSGETSEADEDSRPEVAEQGSNSEGEQKAKSESERVPPAENPQLASSTRSGTAIRNPQSANRQFASLPEIMPLSLRLELIQFIQSNLKRQMAGATDFKKGFIEDQVKTVTVKSKGGIFGIGSKKPEPQVSLRKNSPLLTKFEELIDRYENDFDGLNPAEMQSDSDEPTGDALNYDQQLRALDQYLSQVTTQKELLQESFLQVPPTYKPELYIVEMNFTDQVDKMVRLIQSIDSTAKWLFVRNIRMSVDAKNRNQANLGVALTLVAKIF